MLGWDGGNRVGSSVSGLDWPPAAQLPAPHVEPKLKMQPGKPDRLYRPYVTCAGRVQYGSSTVVSSE